MMSDRDPQGEPDALQEQSAAAERSGKGGASRPVKMIDVAHEAGVSRATVSLVMTGSPSISKRTTDKVLDAAQRLGYVYDRTAATLRNRRSHIIGLVVTDLRNPFFGEIAATIQQELANDDYFTVIASSLDSIDLQRIALTRLREQRVEGIILVPCPETTKDDIRELNSQVPVILLNRSIGSEDVSYVGSADFEAGFLAATHLIVEHGCRSLGFFGSNTENTAGSIRLKGIVAAAKKHGVQVDGAWAGMRDTRAEEAYHASTSLLANATPPDGLVCNSDTMAFGVMKALSDRGYRKVSDCRVIGFDDIGEAALWNPSLSSVAVKRAVMGRSAASLILATVQRDIASPQVIRHSVELITRASCGCSSSNGRGESW